MIVLGLLVAAADPTGPWVSVTGAAAVILALGTFAYRFLRRNDDQYRVLVKPAYERVAAVEADNADLQRRLEVAIRLLRQNGIDATEVLQ